MVFTFVDSNTVNGKIDPDFGLSSHETKTKSGKGRQKKRMEKKQKKGEGDGRWVSKKQCRQGLASTKSLK